MKMLTVRPPIHQLPLRGLTAGFHRFSVADYHRLTEEGILGEDDDIELIDGYLVQKMSKNAPHEGSMQILEDMLRDMLPKDWMMRCQKAITLSASEPEPDLAIVVRQPQVYLKRHPVPAEIGIVIEVADSSLASDRQDKHRIYALEKLPQYWIVNLVNRCVEVYGQPSGRKNPSYRKMTVYDATDLLPVIINGKMCGTIPVAEFLPLAP